MQLQTDDRFADFLVLQSWNELDAAGRRAPQEHVKQQNNEFVVDHGGERLVSHIMGSWAFSPS